MVAVRLRQPAEASWPGDEDAEDTARTDTLGLTPDHTRTFTPWRRADYVASPGDDRARRTTTADAYDIRYRIVWVGED